MSHRNAKHAVAATMIVVGRRESAGILGIVQAKLVPGHGVAGNVRTRQPDQDSVQDEHVDRKPAGELAPEARLRAGRQDGHLRGFT
jgi:hypothetical protein